MYQLLSNMTVVEGASFIAGPSCALHLAQMGARVIRFDAIGGGPDFRRWPVAENGASLYWEGLNKGKESIAIDLARPEGRELAIALITASGERRGLFVTNYPAAGFLAHEKLAGRRADLITLRVMGWPDGRNGVDYTINAAVGIPFMTGPEPLAADQPVNSILPAWDLLTGAYGAFALMAAERRRNETGAGAEIRLALSDVAAGALGHLGQIAETMTGPERSRSGNALFGAFGRDFATRDGQRLMIVAITERQWTGLLASLNITAAVGALEAELGVSFRTDEGQRYTHRDRLFMLVEAAVAQRTRAELAPVFDKEGVCWEPYRTLASALAQEPRLVSASEVFASGLQPSGLRYPLPGAFARMPGDVRLKARPAPRLGSHTEKILAEDLALPQGEIARLHDAGIVASAR